MGSYEKTFSKNSQNIIGVRLRQNGSPVPPCERQPWQGQYSNWPEEAVSLEPKTRHFLEAKRQWKKDNQDLQMNMDGEQSVQTIGAIFLMHFASFSTKRTR